MARLTPLAEPIVVNVPVDIAAHGQLLSSFNGAVHEAIQQGLVGGYGSRVQEAVAAGTHQEGVLPCLLSLAAETQTLLELLMR